MLSSFLALGLFVSADLTEVDRFLKDETFETSFRVGDEVVFERGSCIGGSLCDGRTARFRVKSVDDAGVVIVTENLDGSGASEERVERASWDAAQGNRVRQKVQFMESFGMQTELRSLREAHAPVMLNGSTQAIPVLVLEISGRNASGMGSDVLMHVSRGIGGLAQLLLTEEKKVVGNEFLRVQGVKRRP